MIHKVPILSDPQVKSQARSVGKKKNVILIGGLLFTVFFTRMGVINRVLIALFGCTSLIFFMKSKTYM